jgi:hypothetical protein
MDIKALRNQYRTIRSSAMKAMKLLEFSGEPEAAFDEMVRDHLGQVNSPTPLDWVRTAHSVAALLYSELKNYQESKLLEEERYMGFDTLEEYYMDRAEERYDDR